MAVLTSRFIRTVTALLTAVAVTVVAAGPVPAQTLQGSEYRVKAAFIYNFAKFVKWPEGSFDNATDQLVLCITPDSPATDAFYSLDNKVVGGRKLRVRKCSGVREIPECRILFIASTDKAVVRESLLAAEQNRILTIGETAGFTQMGGIINFFNEKGNLRFEVNLDAAGRAGLELGSQVLMSAEIIREDRRRP